MPFHHEDSKRSAIPRWKPIYDPATIEIAAGPLRSQRRTPTMEAAAAAELASAESQWLANPCLATAAEFISAATIAGQVEVALSAAELIIEDANSPTSLTSHARSVVVRARDSRGARADGAQVQPTHDRGPEIALLRARLRAFPFDGLSWLQLGWLHASQGSRDRAMRCGATAHQLFPHSRVVVRAYSRLLNHFDLLDKATWVVERVPALERDPWLMSAYLAACHAVNASPPSLRKARALAASSAWSPKQRSELSAAIATLEAAAGAHKKARALLAPVRNNLTDNALAQFAWLERTGQIGASILADHDLRSSSEALAWHHFLGEEWEEAVVASRTWLEDQPFSSRPAKHGSYVSLVTLDDYESCVAITDVGLKANPSSFCLINHRVIALARLGRVEAAQGLWRRVSRSSLDYEDQVVMDATSGLLHSRAGDPGEAFRYYSHAIDGARASQLPVALLFKAQELLFHGRVAEAQSAAEAASVALQGRSVSGPNAQLLCNVRSQLDKVSGGAAGSSN